MFTCEWPTPDLPRQAPFVVRQVQFLRKAGVDVDVFFFRGSKNPLKYLRAWWNIHRQLRRESYDLVHAQWGQSAVPVLPTRLPLVVSFRGGEVDGIVGDDGRYTLWGRALQVIGWHMARRADQLVLVSAHIARLLPKRPVHVSLRDSTSRSLFWCRRRKRAASLTCLKESGWCCLPAIQSKRESATH